MIGGAASKWVWTSEFATKSRATKQARTMEPTKKAPPCPADKGKKAMEQLWFATDNELLNAAEVTPKSTPASIAKMLCEKMFEGIPNASDPLFLALVSHLACSTKQHVVFSSHPLDDLEDSLREMFLMVSHLLFLRIFLTSLTFLTLFLFFCGRPLGYS